MSKILYLLSILFLTANGLYAQSLNEWQIYPSFSTINALHVYEGVVYNATMGGVTVVNGNETAYQLTTMDGLHRSDPTAIVYDSENNKIITGYIDGTLDVIDVETKEITHLEDINRVTRFNTKMINALKIVDQSLYVSTAFGVVIYDLKTLLVDDSYIKLGEFNIGIQVNEVDVLEDFMYAATTAGIVVLNYGETALSWQNYDSTNGLPPLMVEEIVHFNSTTYALIDGIIYELQENNWVQSTIFDQTEYQSIDTNSERSLLVTSTNNTVYIIDTDENIDQVSINSHSRVGDVKIEGSKLYIGTTNEGLLTIDLSNNEQEFFLPSGPYLNYFSQLLTDGQTLVSTSTEEFPGADPFNPIRGYYLYSNNEWNSFNNNTNSTINSANFNSAYSVGQNDSSYFIGSWGYGIARHNKSSNEITVFNSYNSSLSGIRSSSRYVVISDIDSDADNNVWAISYLSENPLNLQLKNTDEWINFSGRGGGDEYFDLFIDSFDQKWISLITNTNSGRGLLVMDTGNPTDPSDDVSVKLTSSINNGNLPDDHVNAIVEDKNGEVWIGTSRGIAKFIFPELIIDGGPNERQAQWLINEDTTEASRYLLRDVNVTAIAVNEANQKWIGSANQGLWLVNDEGSRIEKYFSTNNSDLISNTIQSISINDETGEVFISTDLGLVSYQDVPKQPVVSMDKLKVYPNPFEYSRHNQVLVEGLSDRTSIKVLGVDGVVVNELVSQGGRISWNGLDYNGNQLGSGVYFIIAFEPDGDQRGAGKVVIIR